MGLYAKGPSFQNKKTLKKKKRTKIKQSRLIRSYLNIRQKFCINIRNIIFLNYFIFCNRSEKYFLILAYLRTVPVRLKIENAPPLLSNSTLPR